MLARFWTGRAIGWLGLCAVLLGTAGSAQARTLELSWSHGGRDSAGNPVRFRVHHGSAPGSYAQVVDTGPLQRSGGLYHFQLEVPDGPAVYVALSAYSSAAQSGLSSERKYGGSSVPAPLVRDSTAAGHPALILAPPADSGLWFDTGPDNALERDETLFAADTAADALFTHSTATNIHSHLVAPATAQWTHYEFRGRMLVTDANGGIGVTLASNYPHSDAYYRLRRFGSGGFTLSSHPGPLSCPLGEIPEIPVPNAWYHFRIQFQDDGQATLIRARVWRDGEPEPTNWPLNCQDDQPTRRLAGTTGVWAMGPGSKYWADLYVIGLDIPPPPSPPRPPILLPPAF